MARLENSIPLYISWTIRQASQRHAGVADGTVAREPKEGKVEACCCRIQGVDVNWARGVVTFHTCNFHISSTHLGELVVVLPGW